jgi:hypothetical protein
MGDCTLKYGKGVGEGGRNDPNIVCTCELKKKKEKKKKK